jgi:CheY-like chemotaxis protein
MRTYSVDFWGAETAAPHSAYILVVEDELFVRMSICDVLREAGYRVLEAYNGDEAVDILASGAHVDLILSDVRMPGSVDGLGLLAFAKESYPHLPVVFSSAHLSPRLAFGFGADDVLPKPYTAARALEVIKALLDRFI